MIRTVFRKALPWCDCRENLRQTLAGLALIALLTGGCTQQGLAPNAIPDVPPLDQGVAEEMPEGTISTVPDGDVPPPVSGHAPVLPSSPPQVTPMTGATPESIAAAPPAGQRDPEEQRVAALELSLINMNNELNWLKNQAASPQVASPQSKPVLAGEAQQRTERITNLEENIKAIQAELDRTRSQLSQPASPGTPSPGEALIQAEAQAAPPRPTSLDNRRPVIKVGEFPVKPEPLVQEAAPAPVVPSATPVQQSAAATPVQQPPQSINLDTVTRFPILVPVADVAGKTVPPPSRESIATPPLQSQASRPSVQAPAQPAVVRPAAVGTVPAAVNTPSGAVAPAMPKAQQGEQGVYQAAYNAYEAKRYNEAWNAFDRYLEAYPNGRYAPNAFYWKGEVRYSLGDYPGAIMMFKEVLARYPQHPKAPDALLKIVMSYNRLQDKDNASLHLRILKEDYPESNATRRAKSMGLS